MEKQQQSPNILMVTHNSPALIAPPDPGMEGECRYGVGFPFQVAPRLGGLLCNIRAEEQGMADSEIGVDIVLFDDHRHIGTDCILPVARVEKTKDQATGAMGIILRYPASIGFVPAGARLPDGSAHPHAGTGFCLIVSRVYPEARFKRNGESSGISPIRGVLDGWCEVYQLRFDGTTIVITGSSRTDIPARDTLRPPIDAGGMSPAIPDEKDLLLPCHSGEAFTSDRKKGIPGVSRWEYGPKGWQPVRFDPVGPDNWYEPSLARDVDGSLLFTSRSYLTGLEPHFCLWKSDDSGGTWNRLFQSDYGRTECPLSINRAADGTPYFAANAKVQYNHWNFSRILREKGGGQKFGRAKLAIWELTENRKGLLHPRSARNFFDSPDFFTGAESSYWRADHPIGSVVQLADGKWHSLLAYRVMFREKHESSGAPKPQTGLYVEEILCEADSILEWTF